MTRDPTQLLPMSVLTTRPAYDDESFAAIYYAHFELLIAIAIRKFRVPEHDAATLVHEVFLTYLRKSDTILDLRNWLVGAICHASRYYWRQNGREYPVDCEELDRIDPASQRIVDILPDQLAAREALGCLSPRCQEILRMRYFDGCSVPEIAEHLGVSAKYAAKLVAKCLRRAEKMYGEKGKAR